MPFIPVPNVAQVEVVAIANNERMQNVLHYAGGNSSSITELQALAGSVNLLWETHVAPLMSSRVAGDIVIATDLTTQNGPSVEVDSAWVGGVDFNTDPLMPHNVTLALKKLTGLRGKSFRGRLYHMCFSESQISNNQVLDPPLSNLTVAYNQLIEVSAGGQVWTLQVVSRYSGGVPRAQGIATPVISFTAVNSVVDSQRRRLPD